MPLRTTAATFLLERSAAPPEERSDWVIETRIPCDCAHCRRLQAFCTDPAATVIRCSMRQDLRSHVEASISGQRLDIRYETERRGSPHTLICTKTRTTYERRCTQYAQDIANVRLLITAAAGADNLQRLHASPPLRPPVTGPQAERCEKRAQVPRNPLLGCDRNVRGNPRRATDEQSWTKRNS